LVGNFTHVFFGETDSKLELMTYHFLWGKYGFGFSAIVRVFAPYNYHIMQDVKLS